jgi:hypothetical protein
MHPASSRRDRPTSARFAVAAATAAAVARDDFAYRAAFDGLSGPERDAVGHGVLDALRERGRVTGDQQFYGWASNCAAWSYQDGAGASFCAGLDAEVQRQEKRRPKDRRRAIVARAARAALRGGADDRGATVAAVRANLKLSDPLPRNDVEDILSWAKKHRRGDARG